VITIANIRESGKPSKAHHIYIGRACYGLAGSPLGNPYSVLKFGRDRAIELFAWDLRAAMEGVPDVNKRGVVALADMRAEMRRLYDIWKRTGELRLFCWCYPAKCHGEVIRDVLMRMPCPTCNNEPHPHGGPDCPTCGKG